MHSNTAYTLIDQLKPSNQVLPLPIIKSCQICKQEIFQSFHLDLASYRVFETLPLDFDRRIQTEFFPSSL